MFAYTTSTIKKDVYLTYETFIKESKEKQTNKQTFSAPSDWLRLKAQDPIIAKFQVSPGVLLSITKFSGNIGSELANINRWRSQLKLPPVDDVNSDTMTRESFENYTLRTVTIKSDREQYLIYWITNQSTHYFNKVSSRTTINSTLIKTFITSQEWPNS